MQSLEKYLTKLSSLAKDTESSVDPTALIEDLRNLCIHEISESDMGKNLLL